MAIHEFDRPTAVDRAASSSREAQRRRRKARHVGLGEFVPWKLRIELLERSREHVPPIVRPRGRVA